MMNTSISTTYPVTDIKAIFMRRVYTWMTGGLLLTAFVASFLGQNPDLLMAMMQTPILFYGMIIAQVVAVIALSAAINKISSGTATLIYLVYAALTGATLSSLFLVYTQDSIAGVFLATASGFAGLSLIGYTTKRDLGPVGAFCGMALFGMIGWGLLSFFFPSMMGGNAQFAYSIVGVLVFSGLTAYDTQKIGNMALGLSPTGEGEMASKAAIFGALTLYLDFINLFLSLMRLFGNRRD